MFVRPRRRNVGRERHCVDRGSSTGYLQTARRPANGTNSNIIRIRWISDYTNVFLLNIISNLKKKATAKTYATKNKQNSKNIVHYLLLV